MHGMARGQMYGAYVDRGTRILGKKVSVALVWRGAVAALAGGLLAGVLTAAELMAV